MSGFAQRLRKAMHEAGFERSDLRRALGCSYQAVDAWFTGERVPSTVCLAAICKALGVSADYLLGLKEATR